MKEGATRQARERADLAFDEVCDKDCHAFHWEKPLPVQVASRSGLETPDQSGGPEPGATRRNQGVIQQVDPTRSALPSRGGVGHVCQTAGLQPIC